jgi:5-methyltetrahydrofolate corrinoid/iron sulfur protein methyltransferase
MVSGFEKYNQKSHAFINSTPSDAEKFEKLTELMLDNSCNIVALTLSKETGIPKTADGRLEIACDMYERFIEKGVDTDKIYFDPLVLPITADQSQASEAINTIKMIKESFDPPVRTVVGLSNVSNGCPSHLRSLINRVFAVLAYGAGLDAAIIDAKDAELVRIVKMLEKSNPTSNTDELYIRLASMIENFEELESVCYNKDDSEESLIVKTAGIILNKNIYSDSFTQI